MSVSIGWAPNKPDSLNYVDGGSSFYDALQKAFGAFPLELDSSEVKTLYGIKACGYDGAMELIDAIYKYDSIRVEARW